MFARFKLGLQSLLGVGSSVSDNSLESILKTVEAKVSEVKTLVEKRTAAPKQQADEENTNKKGTYRHQHPL